ncbi:MAG: hypothetical protein WAQ28_13635 [Bacteroidia bacterium]
MKFKPNDIFKKYPEIEDIAIRLDESEKEAKEKNKGRGAENKEPVSNNEESGKRVFMYFAEHAVISYFYKEGRWEQTPYTLKPGREAFLKDLAKILETRDPDAIKVEIYKGKTRKTEPVYSKDIYLSENQPETDNVQEHPGLGSLVKRFDETLSETKKNPDTSGFQIELLRKEFEAQLKEQQHGSEIKELKQYHQSEINTLQSIITQKDEYIEELEDELDEYEGELNGFHEESKKEKSTPFSEIILGRVLVQAGENLLKQNPKILKIGLGLSDEEVKKIFEKDAGQLESAKTNDTSGFSESTNDLTGLDEKQIQGINDLIQFFKQVNVSEFKKLFTIDCMLQDPKTGMLNNDLADKVLQFINQNKPNE